MSTQGYDLIDRGAPQLDGLRDFLTSRSPKDNFAFNPPFEIGEEFALHALSLVRRKVAMVYPTRRLNAAGKWLRITPLCRIWYLTPRPSMPPGSEYERLQRAGKEAQGSKQDFCILVWEQGHEGPWSGFWLQCRTPIPISHRRYLHADGAGAHQALRSDRQMRSAARGKEASKANHRRAAVKATELAQTLADSVGIKKAQATDLLKNLGVAIATTLKDGGEITIPGAGKFVAKQRAARAARNPLTGGTVEVPAKNVPAFKPAAELKRALAA